MTATGFKTGYIYDGGDPIPVKYAAVNRSTTGAIVAAVAGKKIRVLEYVLSAAGAVNTKWQSASTDLTGLTYFAAAGDNVSCPFSPVGHFQTAVNEALNLNFSGAVVVGGHIAYAEVNASSGA
jgi:hypothetical protein